ncbi:developmentally regulated GTP binding protein 1 [Mycena olivaceomarginata]|nr:developmentally regulated GTP binding protein 1 [Mycena olivaceomarginata]
MTTVQKIKEVEDEMATSYHLGQLKAKLAKLRRGRAGIGFDVARTGVASVGFVGFPSVGKSTLMSKLTGTHSEVSAIDFTTLTTVPGTVKVHGAPSRFLDLPGIIEGAKRRSWSRSPKIIEGELEGFGIRLNKKPPAITFRRKEKGGISITHTVPLTNIDHDDIKGICSEFKINNCDIAIREPGATADDLVDVIEGNRVYIPALYILNKVCSALFDVFFKTKPNFLQIDAISIEELDLLYKIPMSVPISSKDWLNIDELIEKMWETLDLVRVYTKPRGLAPDYTQPVDFCNSIHKEIAKQMKYAKHSRGQKVGLDHILEDEDVVHISKK